VPKEKYDGEPGTEDRLKDYEVEVTWKSRGIVRVQAKSLAEAIDASHNCDVPLNVDMVDDSWEPDLSSTNTQFLGYAD